MKYKILLEPYYFIENSKTKLLCPEFGHKMKR